MRVAARKGVPKRTLRGRDTELTALGQHLDQLLSGVGTVVLVEGGAGMGKSRLLQETAEMAHRLSIGVGSGTADPSDTMVQLSALMRALFEGQTPILNRSALGDAHASPEQRYWLLQDLEALLESAALQGPLLVCLDDVQWADAGTAAALRALPSRLASVPIGWVIAVRSGQWSQHVRSALESLEQEGAAKIELGPLDHAGIALMAADILGAQPDVELLKMAERPAGNPFLLVELLSGLREEDLVRIDSGEAQLVEWRLPQRVSQSMRLRLEGMSDSARRVASVAGALGRSVVLDDVATMLKVAPSELLAPVEELIDADLLAECDDRLVFVHDLTFEAVRASIPGSVRRSLDRQAAAVLLDGGALPVEVATQLAESAEPGDEMAIATLLKAAEALGATDPGSAADLGQRALELAPRRHRLRGPLVAQTAVWLHAAGRAEEAKAFADTALHQAFPAEEEAEVRLSIGGMFALSPDMRAEESRQALALPGLPARLRARHLAWLFHSRVTAGRMTEARALLEETRAAVEIGDDVLARFALELAESGLLYAGGRFSAGLDMVERALRSGLDAGDDTRFHLTYQWRCDTLTAVDRLDESLQMSTEGVASAQRDRQGWALGIFETGRGRQLLQMGRLADSAAALEGQLSVEAAPQIVSVLDAAGVVALGRVAIHMGDQGLSRRVRQIAQVVLGQSAPSVRRHAAWLLALQEMADGEAARAHEWLCTLGGDERLSLLPLFPMDVADESRMIHIAQAVADEDLAACAGEAAQYRAQLNPENRSIAAAAAHARGLLEHSPKVLKEAAALYEGGPRPLAYAATLEDLGIATVDEGETEEAVGTLGRALEIYVRVGAAWDAGRIRGRLRALGVRRRLPASQRPERGWAALTESELAVARLVAEGLTNREVAEQLFVSQHTVSGHLRHVFTKLDVNSRVELTRLASIHHPDVLR